MKIVINGQTMLSSKNSRTGPYVYLYQLVKHLALVDKSNHYIVYFAKENFDMPNKLEDFFQANPNFSYRVLPKVLLWTQISMAFALWQDMPDIFFSSTHTVPGLMPPWVKRVTMIHGLEYNFSPVTKNLAKFYQPFPIWYSIMYATRIIVPSLATKNAIYNRLPLAKLKKINVVFEGLNSIYKKTPAEEVERVRAKYNITEEKYFMFISTIQPRKNVPNMIAGFAQALKEQNLEGKLRMCIVGKKGWLYEESFEAPKKYGVENSVSFLGPAPDEDLPALLSGAAGYINLSFEEGFGLTVLEGMACGAPCLISDIEAHRELGESAAIFADPKNIEDIKQKIIKLLSLSDEEREVLVQHGYSTSSKYNWRQTALETLKIFEQVAGKK